jgi:SAM-dependent methyltransferase
LYGVEPSPACVDFVKEHYGIDARTGTADNIPFDIKFDVIISTHVFEHVLNLKEVVENISRQLYDNGLVYIEVPDLEGYDLQGNISPLDYITFYEHINHFTIQSLNDLFKWHGFSMAACGRKMLAQDSRLPLPVLYGVFRKGASEECASLPVESFDVNKVYRWLNTLEFYKDDRLEELAASKTPVYIWGINLFVQKMLSMSLLRKCNIAGLLDRDPAKQKKTINGIKVQSPEIIKTVDADAVVVIWDGPYKKSIEEDLYGIGYRGKVIII